MAFNVTLLVYLAEKLKWTYLAPMKNKEVNLDLFPFRFHTFAPIYAMKVWIHGVI